MGLFPNFKLLDQFWAYQRPVTQLLSASLRERNSTGVTIETEDSHIFKHHQIHHGGEGDPQFHMKVVKFHKTALKRQVGEAVRIRRRGEVLNSKGEFNRCSITRLTLPESPPTIAVTTQETHECGEGDEGVSLWSDKGVGKPPMSDPQKRVGDSEGSKRPSKRRKFNLVEDGWGEQESPQEGDSDIVVIVGAQSQVRVKSAPVPSELCQCITKYYTGEGELSKLCREVKSLIGADHDIGQGRGGGRPPLFKKLRFPK